MSDNWMIVIPVDPLVVPPKECAEAAFALLTTMRPEAQDPELYLSDKPEFFDCGSNFGNVFCAFCGTDIMEWWRKPFEAWWDSGDRRNLSVQTRVAAAPRPSAISTMIVRKAWPVWRFR
jgi:hypothetical protein